MKNSRRRTRVATATKEKKLAYSPKRAMAELRHSSSIGSRATASPMKRDDVTSPLAPENLPHDDDGRDRHSRDRVRSLFSNFQSLYADETRPHSYNSKISLFVLILLILAGLLSLSSILNRLVSIGLLLYSSVSEFHVIFVILGGSNLSI